MSTLDRGSETSGETAPATLDQQISEGRPERDELRADAAEFDTVDPMNVPAEERQKDLPEQRPWTSDEPGTPGRHAAAVADDSAETGAAFTASEAQISAENHRIEDAEPRRAGELTAPTDDPGEASDTSGARDRDVLGQVRVPEPPRYSLVFNQHSDAHAPDPGDVGWYRHDDDGDNRAVEPVDQTETAAAETGSGEEPGSEAPDHVGTQEPSTYADPSDVREALMSGKSVPDVKRDLMNQPSGPRAEATTELVHEKDGLRYELGTPTNDPDRFGERVTTEESDKTSRRERVGDGFLRAAGDGTSDAQKFTKQLQDAISHRLPPGSHGETTTGQEAPPTIETRQPASIDAGNLLAGMLAAGVAGAVLFRRCQEKVDELRGQRKEQDQ